MSNSQRGPAPGPPVTDPSVDQLISMAELIDDDETSGGKNPDSPHFSPSPPSPQGFLTSHNLSSQISPPNNALNSTASFDLKRRPKSLSVESPTRKITKSPDFDDSSTPIFPLSHPDEIFADHPLSDDIPPPPPPTTSDAAALTDNSLKKNIPPPPPKLRNKKLSKSLKTSISKSTSSLPGLSRESAKDSNINGASGSLISSFNKYSPSHRGSFSGTTNSSSSNSPSRPSYYSYAPKSSSKSPKSSRHGSPSLGKTKRFSLLRNKKSEELSPSTSPIGTTRIRSTTYVPNSCSTVTTVAEFPEFMDHPALLGPDIVFRRGAANDIQVRGATLKKLVLRLTYSHFLSPDFTEHFFLTYQSIATPNQLMDNLFERFQITNSSSSGITDQEFAAIKSTVHLRVINVLRLWIGKYNYGDFQSPNLLKKLESWVEEVASKEEPSYAKKLTQAIINFKTKFRLTVTLSVSEKPEPILPPSNKKLSIYVISPVELGRQFTMIESGLYCSIRPRECLDCNWSKDDRDTLAPNITRITNRFNRVGSWVAREIVKHESKKSRIEAIQCWILIAHHLLSLNNFNGANEIYGGLGHSSVFRLKKTWAGIKRSSQKQFESLKTVLYAKSNFIAMREAVYNAKPPLVPYIGLWFKDLTFISEGNGDKLTDCPRLFNFTKRRSTAKVISQILLYQSKQYNFEIVDEIQSFIDSELADYWDDDKLWAISQKNEERTI